jgi:hypothetical protein
MFWFFFLKGHQIEKDRMCHFLFILIPFKVPIRVLSYFHMPMLLHLHWWTYVPFPPSLEPRTRYHPDVKIFIDNLREANV